MSFILQKHRKLLFLYQTGTARRFRKLRWTFVLSCIILFLTLLFIIISILLFSIEQFRHFLALLCMYGITIVKRMGGGRQGGLWGTRCEDYWWNMGFLGEVSRTRFFKSKNWEGGGIWGCEGDLEAHPPPLHHPPSSRLPRLDTGWDIDR